MKKNELVVGKEANAGWEWQPTGTPERVEVHDFPDPEVPKAIPYGVYDIGADDGWMEVGSDHDTAAFAVNTIRRWWETMGKERYPTTTRLMITADVGGSNGYRNRLWKRELCRPRIGDTARRRHVHNVELLQRHVVHSARCR